MRVTMFDATLNYRADQLPPREFVERIGLTTLGIILGASVRPTDAGTPLPPICFGLIDRRSLQIIQNQVT